MSDNNLGLPTQVMVYKDLTCGINVAESRWNDVFVREVIWRLDG